MRRAVFLDRDGVLNRAYETVGGVTRPPSSLDELVVLPGVDDACRRLRDAGFLLIVVSNQPDVARGTQLRERVEEINDALRRAVEVDDVLVCYHDDRDDCACRKPRPGLLLEGAARFGVDLSTSFIVGDRWSDVEAGRRAGCSTIRVGPDRSERNVPADFRAADLVEGARQILKEVSAA